MLTSTHALMGTWFYRRKFAALAGSVLPDVPILLYFLETRTWTQYPGRWGSIIDAFHSIPLIGVGLGISLLASKPAFATFFGAMGLHAIVDFLTHHTDAHAQFFPFSTFRFESPLSYWDVAHRGRWGALVEVLIVVLISQWWIRTGVSRWRFWGLVALQSAYLSTYAYVYFPWK